VAENTTGLPVAGWYPDRPNPTALRWWDGTAWTDHWHQLDAGTGPSPVAPSRPPTGPTSTGATGTAPAGTGPTFAAPTLSISPEPPTPEPSTADGASDDLDTGGYPRLGREIPPDRSWMFQKAKRSTQTIAGWLLALSPLWLGVAVIAALVLLPGLPALYVQAGLAIVVVTVTVLLVILDARTLRSRGLASPSVWWMLLPLVYLVMRVVRVGRASVGLVLTYLLAHAALAALVVYLVLQTTLLSGLTLAGIPLGEPEEGSTGTVTAGEPELTAAERAELLTPAGTEAWLREDLSTTWEVGDIDCPPFPSKSATATVTCLVELDGEPYNAGLQVTPDEPTTAFVLTGMLPAE